MTNKYYLTTAIPYVNAAPHIGFALELVQADAIARYQRLLGREVYFLTGSDENALKNVQAAEKAGLPVRQFVDQNAAKFEELKKPLNLSFDQFIKTSQPRHIAGAQALWNACRKEDIYRKKYSGLYCLGCEEFKTEKELVEGKCPEHPTLTPEKVEEENYFFRLSAYQDWLEEIISQDKLKIVPEIRKNEVLSFIKRGLEDFSVSRSVKRSKGWGVPVPDDPEQIMYVWFDALANYITALDWQENSPLYQKYWPAEVHVIGKGISRFHAIYWPAMLKSAGLAHPKSIFIHGYVTAEGQKISKSLGNTVDPYKLAEEFGTDPVRYYLLREIPAYGDGDFSIARFKEVYNADLANGLGNLVARVAKLSENSGFGLETRKKNKFNEDYQKLLDAFRFDEALAMIWGLVRGADKTINEGQVWKQTGEKLKKSIRALTEIILDISYYLEPFLPDTAVKIQKQFGSTAIKSEKPLFPRLK